nr:LAGLIDADG endonuclease [Synchytrium endobioticum]
MKVTSSASNARAITDLIVSTGLYSGNPLNNRDQLNLILASFNWTILCVGKPAGKPSSSTGEMLSHNFPLPDHHSKSTPNTDKEFGSYLAGLIEADGCFGDRRLEIVLHEKDIQLAYTIRKLLGSGFISKIQDKKAIKFTVRKQEGLKRVLNLINGQMVDDAKLVQIRKHNLDKLLNSHCHLLPPLNSIPTNNFWLAGFLDGDGSLGIFLAKSLTHRLGVSVRLEVKFTQKLPLILKCIQDVYGGNMHVDKKGISRLNISAILILKSLFLYLDKFPPQSLKSIQYFLIRRTYRMMERKEHLTIRGLSTIKISKERLQAVYKSGRDGRQI